LHRGKRAGGRAAPGSSIVDPREGRAEIGRAHHSVPAAPGQVDADLQAFELLWSPAHDGREAAPTLHC
jgi:hypothetical protein